MDRDSRRPRIVLPYDGSPASRAALRRAAAAVGGARHLYRGLLIATVGIDPASIGAPLEDARRAAKFEHLVEVVWLNPTDPLGSLRQLFAEEPDAHLAVPLGARGRAPWLAEAYRVGGMDTATMVFFLRPHELLAVADEPPPPSRITALIDGLRRGLAQRMPRRPAPSPAWPRNQSTPHLGRDRIRHE